MSRLESAPDHSELLELIGREIFHTADVCNEWIPSDEADIFRLESPVAGSARIVKIARADGWIVHREQRVLGLLRPMGFPELPEIELTQDDLGMGEPFFNVTPATPWHPFEEIWHAGADRAIWVMHRAGGFLRRLSTIDWVKVPGAAAAADKASEHFAWFESLIRPLKTHPEMDGELGAALESILSMFATEPAGFGGWQGGQILTDGVSSFTAIDWPHIGAHWPLGDLAGLTTTLGFYSDDAPPILLPELLDAYFDGAPTTEEAAELTLWRVSCELGIAVNSINRGDRRGAASSFACARELLTSSTPSVR